MKLYLFAVRILSISNPQLAPVLFFFEDYVSAGSYFYLLHFSHPVY